MRGAIAYYQIGWEGWLRNEKKFGNVGQKTIRDKRSQRRTRPGEREKKPGGEESQPVDRLGPGQRKSQRATGKRKNR